LGADGARAEKLLEVDLATGAERDRPDAGRDGDTGAGEPERSHDGTTLAGNWSGCLQRYDIVGDSFGPCQKPRVGDWPPSVDATGEHIALGTDVYDGSLQFLRRVHTTISENSIAPTALSVDGEYLYLALSKWVLRSRVSDGALLDRFAIPSEPTSIRASPDGRMLVIVENHFSTTSTINTVDLR
jgi:hypothetical protein